MTEPRYSVVRPIGRWAGQPVPLRAANGPRRIGFVWDHVFRGDEMFSIVADEFEAQGSHLTFVGHQAFGDIHGRDGARVVASLPARLRAEEVDTVIVGVGA